MMDDGADALLLEPSTASSIALEPGARVRLTGFVVSATEPHRDTVVLDRDVVRRDLDRVRVRGCGGD